MCGDDFSYTMDDFLDSRKQKLGGSQSKPAKKPESQHKRKLKSQIVTGRLGESSPLSRQVSGDSEFTECLNTYEDVVLKVKQSRYTGVGADKEILEEEDKASEQDEDQLNKAVVFNDNNFNEFGTHEDEKDDDDLFETVNRLDPESIMHNQK